MALSIQQALADDTPLNTVQIAALEDAILKIQHVLKIAEEPLSLEKPVGDEDDSTLADFIEDQAVMMPMDEAEKEILREQINNSLSSLSEHEREVLELRYGLIDGRERSLEELSQQFNVTRTHPPNRSQSIAQAAPSKPQQRPARVSIASEGLFPRI